MSDEFIHSALILHAALTLFLTGVIWFVQIVHYPLMDRVSEDFPAFQKAHADRTTIVVMVPMLIELGTAILLIWQKPLGISAWMMWFGLGLIIVIWLSTFLLQVPNHEILSKGFNEIAHRRLVTTNWIRTVAWSIRSILVVWLVWLALGNG